MRVLGKIIKLAAIGVAGVFIGFFGVVFFWYGCYLFG